MNPMKRKLVYKSYPQDKNDSRTWKDFKRFSEGKKIALVNGNIELAKYLIKKRYISKIPDYYVETNSSSKKIGEKLEGVDVVFIDDLIEKKENIVYLIYSMPNKQYSGRKFQDVDKVNIYYICRMEEKKISVKLCSFFWRLKYVYCELPPTIKAYFGKVSNWEKSEISWSKFKKICKNKNLIVWGTGNGCRDIIEFYGEYIHIDYLVDNKKENWGEQYRGIPIISPNELVGMSNYAILISSTYYYKDIEKQLLDMGIKEYFFFHQLEGKRIWTRIYFPYLRIKKYMETAGYFKLFGILPIKKNKVVVMRHAGLGFGCHQKYVVLELLKQNPNLQIVWLVNDMKEEFPDNVHTVKNVPINRAYHFSTAKIWLNDGVTWKTIKKRKGQYYINTTHGVGISLKKFGLDAPKYITKQSRENIYYDSEISDLYLAGSTFIANVYQTAFATKCERWVCGSPRIDILLHDTTEISEEVNQKLNIPSDAKVVLYAPTFRQDKLVSSVVAKAADCISEYGIIDFDEMKRVLNEKYGGEWYILVRFHPMARGLCSKLNYSQTVINATWYPDTQELLARADVLITDYSSIMFDMMYAKKDLFIYAPDYEEYVNEERELYFELDELPYPIAKTGQELENNIKEYDKEKNDRRVVDFMNRFGVFEDGNAGKRVAQRILEMMKQ